MEDNANVRIINVIEDLLNKVSNEAKKIDCRKNRLLRKLRQSVADPKGTEDVGVELITFLKSTIGNIFQNIHCLENSIKRENVGSNGLFETLLREIVELKLSNGQTVDNDILRVKSEYSKRGHLDNETLQPDSCDSNVIPLPYYNENNACQSSVRNSSLNRTKTNLSLNQTYDLSQETDDDGWEDLWSASKKGKKLWNIIKIFSYF